MFSLYLEFLSCGLSFVSVDFFLCVSVFVDRVIRTKSIEVMSSFMVERGSQPLASYSITCSISEVLSFCFIGAAQAIGTSQEDKFSDSTNTVVVCCGISFIVR